MQPVMWIIESGLRKLIRMYCGGWLGRSPRNIGALDQGFEDSAVATRRADFPQ
jgi:hypothetical protein